VIEHGGGGHENGIVEGNVNGIAEQEFAEFTLTDFTLFLGGTDGDAGDDVKDIVAAQDPPEVLIIVEDQEFAGRALLEGPESFDERGVFVERRGGEWIEERGEGLGLENRFGDRQAAPKITGASSEGLEKNVAKRRKRTGHLAEQGAADLANTNRSASADAGFMGTISKDGLLAEKVAFAENGYESGFGGWRRRFQDFDLAFFNDAEGARLFALAVNDIAGAIVGVGKLLGGIGAEETEIAGKEEVPGPVLSDLDAAGPVGQFKKIDTAPHEPGYKTGDAHAKHFGYGLVAANGTELAEGFEIERFGGLAFEDADEVESGLAALAFGELRGGGGGLVVKGVDDERTIADGPGVFLAFDAHFRESADAAALFGNIEVLH